MSASVIFDHYEVLRRDDGSLHELGRGAMGITYKAFDTNLRVPVALKVINTTTLDHAHARERFVREARSAAKLRHRHVASVFHLGSSGETYFYAMEFIAGETVEALVRRVGPLSPIVALRVASQVARALGAAQQHGLIHRDIKPANLMLISEDNEMVVKVIDFGLAKVGGEEEGAGSAPGGFVGTPHYASPEQLANKPLDVRSDIYSLGVTLWYLLTGEPPFTGPLEEVISRHRTEAPPVARLGHFPKVLVTLLERLLAKDPLQRPQTAVELRQQIDQCMADVAGGVTPAAAPSETEEQELATILSGCTQEGSERFPPGTVLAERYEVVECMGETSAGLAFWARDRKAGNADVRLLVLSRELLADRSTYTQIERELERIVPSEHPNLLKVFGAETTSDSSFVVLEWTTGFNLVDLLRVRRELTLGEALPLLEQAAAGVDFALESGLTRLDLALHQTVVHFGGPKPQQDILLRMPVAQWPAWTLKLNPLGITRELSLSQTWAGGQTLVGGTVGPTQKADGDLHGAYIQALGGIAYELLGGSLSPLMGGAGARFTPLATLSEDGNSALRRALNPAESFGTSVDFVRALKAADTLDSRRIDAPPPPPPMRVHGSSASTMAPALPKRGKIPVAFVGGLLTVMALGGAMILLVRPIGNSEKVALAPTPSPAPATPAPVVVEPAPEPIPPEAPSWQDRLKIAVTEAEQLEEKQDWAGATSSWVRMTQDYPEPNPGRTRAALLAEELRGRSKTLSDADWARLQPALVDAARADVLPAVILLAEALRDRDPVASFNWYSSAAARGHAGSLTQLGLLLSNVSGMEGNLEKAVACFMQAAELGDPAAKGSLGECFLYGKGIPKDEVRAIALLREAADEGNLRAMNRLGTCYHQGLGVPVDFAEALRLFSKAADQGSGEATGNLGVLYINGDGVPKNARKAVELFQRGSKGGDGYCMYLVARCHESGTGLAPSPPQAREWYRKSAETGYPRAAEWCRKNDVPFKEPRKLVLPVAKTR